MATPTAGTLSMKLLIDRKAQRVLFAEASKDVVDFLFSLLALPVATAVKLAGKDAMVGCVANLYSSVEKLDTTYVQPGAAKDALLSPTVLSPAASATSSLLRLPAAPSSSGQLKAYFKCSSCCGNHVTDTSGGNRMKQATLHFVAPTPSSAQQEQNVAAAGGAKGFVQGIVTYTVMDDLTVTPMSAISSITLLNTFDVRDLADLQERTVQLGYNEGVAILKMSLQSKTVLTDVFLGDKNSAAAGDRA
ncbi:hypothetical protein HU200_055537 [Digitaria exilis]|uniref:DUF674 family protein n=1 Tax=Digitaria exilis TaxID=1010633 RepID=A0A835AID5_9POAL|nr:hypothetical protein HU200_055537 [Digitaria exilis]CAB3472153.1 unnamed protein product [Digitaria exilis]